MSEQKQTGFQIPSVLGPNTEEPSLPSHYIDQHDLYCNGPSPGLISNFITVILVEDHIVRG